MLAAYPAVPITAFSVCSALGRDTRTTFEGLFSEREGLRAPAVELPFRTLAGVVDADLPRLPAEFVMHESRIARIAEQLHSEIATEVARAVAKYGPERVAIVVGTSTGGLAETEHAIVGHTKSGVFPHGYDLDRSHSMAAAVDYLRVRTGIVGPAYAISTACSSSAKVFGCAERLLAANVVDAAIVGGIDTLCQTTLRGFHSLGILSDEACRPFGEGRNGLSLGEGGALFLLEREGEGRANLLGIGESADGFHMSSPHPEGVGAKAAMREALERAGLSASAIGYVNAHGTGTPKNDLVECATIEAVLGTDVPVSSTKRATGHALGAAGAIEAALVIACLERGWMPRSLGADPVDAAVRIHLLREPAYAKIDYAMSNSFGFGGSNACLVFGASR